MHPFKLLACLLLIAGTSFFQPAPAADPVKVTGTFSDLSFNTEGGDLTGTEIRIVRTRKGYQGMLQFAEGGPGEVILVSVRLDGVNIQFDIPLSSPDGGTFQGKITAKELRGEFAFKTGGELKVQLPRRKSYWD